MSTQESPSYQAHAAIARRYRIGVACLQAWSACAMLPALLAMVLPGAASWASPAGSVPSVAGSSPRFTLSSPDPLVAQHLPDTYVANAFGCNGRNASPPLQWKGAPKGTLSYVVTLFDRDERSTPSGWWHWVVYDIPSGVDSLYIGAGAAHSKALPAPALQGRSDLGEDAYHGPCPAKGDPPHRYMFTVYALKIGKLPVPAESSGAMITSTAQDYVLGKAVFVIRYGQK